MSTGVTSYFVAMIDGCSEKPGHEPHLRLPMWPRDDGRPHDPAWLWCLGQYEQDRQGRRVVVAVTDDVEVLVGEGLSVTGSAYREPREPGECGECREPEDFDWNLLVIANDAPCLVCHTHGLLAPGWAYEVEIGLEAWKNDPIMKETTQ